MTDDLRARAAEFYAHQGYDFGPDNVDIVEMLVEFAAAIRAEAKAEGWEDAERALQEVGYLEPMHWANWLTVRRLTASEGGLK